MRYVVFSALVALVFVFQNCGKMDPAKILANSTIVSEDIHAGDFSAISSPEITNKNDLPSTTLTAKETKQALCTSKSDQLMSASGHLVFDYSSSVQCRIGLSQLNQLGAICTPKSDTLVNSKGKSVFDYQLHANCKTGLSQVRAYRALCTPKSNTLISIAGKTLFKYKRQKDCRSGLKKYLAGKSILPSKYEIQIVKGKTSILPKDTRDTQAFILRKPDGSRVIAIDAGKKKSYWSKNGGSTWTAGPKGPATFDMKSAIDLGGGEILSLYSTTILNSDGSYRLPQYRSYDGWKTWKLEIAKVLTPRAVPMTSDGGKTSRNEGLSMHHGVVRLPSGVLVGTMYGNYKEDKEILQGGDAACRAKFKKWNLRKFRVVVVFSHDNGRTWQDPVTVASYHMVRPSSSAVTEGFDEADIVLTASGDLVIAMRTGGRNNDCKDYKSSPIYISRSSNGGKTWTKPTPINTIGSNPNLVALQNGVLVMTFGRPAAWLMFSADNGKTWRNKTALSRSTDNYTDLVPIASDKVLALYFDDDRRIKATVFKTSIVAK